MLSPSHLPELTTEQMLRKDLKTLSNDELVLAISGIYIDLEVRRREGKLRHGAVQQAQRGNTSICLPPDLPAPP